MRVSALASVVVLTAALGYVPASAQHVISAKSGLIHYTEGSVLVGEQPVGQNSSSFQYIANGQTLHAGEGRAEVLLAPGQFLRLNENSSIKMISNKLEDTKLEILSGSAIFEVVELQKGTSLSMVIGNYTLEVRKAGLYRIDTDPAQVRVFKGEAVVVGSGQSTTAKEGKQILLGAVLGTEKFDSVAGSDEFARWAERRAGFIATANVSAAREAFTGSNFSGNNSWYFNPWYGMYTYLPMNRQYMMSPFGFYYFSPDFAFSNSLWPYFGYGYYGNGYYGSGYGYGYSSGGGSSSGSTLSSGSALAKQPFPGAANRGLGNGPRGIARPVFSGPANAFSPSLGAAGRSLSGGGGVANHGGGVFHGGGGGYSRGGGDSGYYSSSNSGGGTVSSASSSPAMASPAASAHASGSTISSGGGGGGGRAK